MNVVFCKCIPPRLLGHAQFIYDQSFTFSTSQIEDQISDLDDQLKKIHPVREKINQYKHKKDDLSTTYIKSRDYSQNIDIKYVNYRALVKQFRSIFEQPQKIQMRNFASNKIRDALKLNKLSTLIGSGVYCKTEEINFPHLIGIKNNPPTINTIKEFINNIHYEQDIIEDYGSHGMDVDKLKSFGWIQNTINDPDLVFLSDAITSRMLKCDIAFVKNINGNAEFNKHVVCMKETHSFNGKPVYSINSQFPKNHGKNLQFDQNKAVFVKI